ncbi:MAG TPA: Ig-like domain-containing protein, partial [Candidatus Nitrosocosmicus sp.]|nr:Ig-like domain-containing protein [Candidatus Nitrosocosmicus sp.]
VTITNPKNNARVPVGNLTVSGTSQDNTGGSGVNNVAVQVNSGSYITATGTTSWSVIVNIPTRGTHRITARAQDNAGNFGFSKVINVRVQ